MRLLQAMAGAKTGGAEAFFERLAFAFSETGIQQKIVIRRDKERAARLAACDITELPFGGMLDFRTKPALSKLVRQFNPDIVLTWMNRATGFFPRGNFVHAARLGGYYNLKYYRHCDHLIGNTRGIVKYLVAEGWPEDRAHYLPNFVTVSPATPEPRSLHNTPDDAPLLLALGRLHPNKAFDVLIAAMPQLPKFHLWIAGDGDEGEVLRAQAAQIGVADRVHFLGWRRDIEKLFAAADMYICPSRHEPLGNVIIEAWAAQKPVVAAASSGPSELIQNGETGSLVVVESSDELAKSISHLWNSKPLQAKYVTQGLVQYQAEFSKAQVVAQYQAFFDKVKR